MNKEWWWQHSQFLRCFNLHRKTYFGRKPRYAKAGQVSHQPIGGFSKQHVVASPLLSKEVKLAINTSPSAVSSIRHGRWTTMDERKAMKIFNYQTDSLRKSARTKLFAKFMDSSCKVNICPKKYHLRGAFLYSIFWIRGATAYQIRSFLEHCSKGGVKAM